MKTKNQISLKQAIAMYRVYNNKTSRFYKNQALLAKETGVSQGWVSVKLQEAKYWLDVQAKVKTMEFDDAYENTVETSTNGFPGALDNTGDEE